MKQYVIVLGILLLGLIAGATDVVLSKGYSIEGANVVISTTTTTTTTTLPGYLVTGNGTLFGFSVNGTYTNAGIYPGTIYYYYVREDGAWSIWPQSPGPGVVTWILNEVVGEADSDFFYLSGESLTEYPFTAMPFCVGTPSAALIP